MKTIRKLRFALIPILFILLSGPVLSQESPPDLVVDGSRARQAAISWSPVTGATGYELWRWNTAAQSWIELHANRNALSYVDVGLVAGNTYYYAVRGLNSEGPVTGWSDYNASESIVTIGSLDAPVLTLDGSIPNQVSIRWSPVSGAYDYELHRWSESASTWSEVDLTGTPLSHIDRAVVAGETYYYVIRALSESEPHGAWSNYRLDSSKVTVIGSGPSSNPSNAAATATTTHTPTSVPTQTPTNTPTNTLTLTPTPTPTPTRTPIVSGGGGGSIPSRPTPTRTPIVSGGGGGSIPSRPTPTRTPTVSGGGGGSIPSRPTPVSTSTPTPTSTPTVTPTPTSTPTPAVTPTPTNTPIPTSTSTRVPRPGPVKGLTATAVTATSITISWSPPDQTPGPTSYIVQTTSNSAGGLSGGPVASGSGITRNTSRTISGLQPCTGYGIRVLASSRLPNGQYSSGPETSISVTTNSSGTVVPASPSGLSATPRDRRVLLRWDRHNGHGVSYEYAYKKSNEQNWSASKSTSNSFVTISSLENGVAYTFRVNVIIACGNVDYPSSWATTTATPTQ